MTEEFEMKMPLSEEEYFFLIKLFQEHICSENVQINYYYDTRTREFRRQNTTVRIRQKGGRFKGTVKKHLPQRSCSIERSFFVSGLSPSFELEEKRVYLQGELKTHRIKIPITDFAVMMIDKNEYLGQTDHELELEYSELKEGEAMSMMLLIEKLLGHKRKSRADISKSERFFRRLEITEHGDLSEERE